MDRISIDKLRWLLFWSVVFLGPIYLIEQSRASSSHNKTENILEGIEIIGNSKTKRSVILANLFVRTGEPLRESQLEASRIRLLSTGYFKSLELSLRRGSERGKVLLVVEVYEQSTLRVEELNLGKNYNNRPYASFGLTEHNLLGHGISISLVAAAGENQTSAEMSFFIPNLGMPTLSSTQIQLAGSVRWLSGEELISDQLSGPKDPKLSYSRIGGTLAAGMMSGPAQSISLVYRLESINADRFPNIAPSILLKAPSTLLDQSLLSSLSLTWQVDSRDDSYAPSKGRRVALSLEVGTSLLGSDYEFSKYTGEFQKAYSLGRRHAMSFLLFGGMVQGKTPFFNQFFPRDFAYATFGRDSLPRVVGLNFSRSNDYDDLIVSARAEYTYTAYSGIENLHRFILFAGLGFTLSAALGESQEDTERRGVGGYEPLSFDLGLKFDTLLGQFTFSGIYVADVIR